MVATTRGTGSPRRRKSGTAEPGSEGRPANIARTQSDTRTGMPRAQSLEGGRAKPPSRLPSPKRSRASSNTWKFDSGSVGGTRAVPGSGSKNNGVSSSARLDVSTRSGLSKSPKGVAPCSSWWSGTPHGRSVIREGYLKKRGGRINTWGERYFVLKEFALEQYGKGDDATTAEPKHIYELDPGCSVSTIKEVRAGGRTLFSFQLDWPVQSNGKEEAEAEAGESSRSGQEDEQGDSEDLQASNGSVLGDAISPLDSPVDSHSRRGGVEEGGSLLGPPLMDRVSSNGSNQGPAQHPPSSTSRHGLRRRRTRSNTSPYHSSATSPPSAAASPGLIGRSRRHYRRDGANALEDDAEGLEERNETIENMMAAEREKETRMARLKHDLSQLNELEHKKQRRQGLKKKDGGKKVTSSRGEAVIVTAAGISWLAAGIATGGLVLAGGLVAAGVTMGSWGAYSKYRNSKNSNSTPSRVRLASDKLEVAEQWRGEIMGMIEKLREVSRLEHEDPGAWMKRGLNLGFPGWTAARKATPLPALKAIDLRVVDEMLANAEWVCHDVVQGLPVMKQEAASANGGVLAGGEGHSGVYASWGLGGRGPVIKTQTIVRASPLETFVALREAPRFSMNAVVSSMSRVQSMDDHSDVIRLCLRPAWLKFAWASPRDFCLARYWHIAENGCYIVCLSSMEHPQCPVDPAFVRGEAHIVYTISPRRDAMPDFHSSPECMLACHVQVAPKGWVWQGFGFQELYMCHILTHVLEVRNVIEAERFEAPRVQLRSADGAVGSGTAASRRDMDDTSDGPFLFEVLGAPGEAGVGESSVRAGGYPMGWREEALAALAADRPVSARGSSSLENVPPPTLNPAMWSEADGTEFMVRGPSYLTSKQKVPSAKQMFRLRAVDMYLLPEPALHLASHPTNRVQVARAAGETTFVWVLQMMVPGPPHYAFVSYFTPEDDSCLEATTPFAKLAQRMFFGDDDAFRDQRLKLIPKIVEGNWVVKRAAGTTPAILGNKLKQHHFRGNNYLETDIEIGSSSVAASVTRLCTGYAKSLVVDMAWTLQGNTDEELPEVVLAGVRVIHLDMMAAKPFDPSGGACHGTQSFAT